MIVLIITAVLFSALLSNSVNAKYEKTITCKTGFFSSDTFLIAWDNAVVRELGYEENCIGSSMVRARSFSQTTRLFSDNKLLDTYLSYKKEPSVSCFDTSTPVHFYWQEKDMRYELSDSHKGWFITTKEKDWSSSEGDHWDEVLERTYCR